MLPGGISLCPDFGRCHRPLTKEMENSALLPGKLGKRILTPVRRGIFTSNGHLNAPAPPQRKQPWGICKRQRNSGRDVFSAQRMLHIMRTTEKNLYGVCMDFDPLEMLDEGVTSWNEVCE